MVEQYGAGAGGFNGFREGGVAGGARRHFGTHVPDRNLHFFGDDGVKPQVGEGLRGLRGDRGGVFLLPWSTMMAPTRTSPRRAKCAAMAASARESYAAAGDQEQGQVGGVRGGGGAGASGGFDASGAEELFEGGGEVAAGSANGGVQASCASILHGGSFI